VTALFVAQPILKLSSLAYGMRAARLSMTSLECLRYYIASKLLSHQTIQITTIKTILFPRLKVALRDEHVRPWHEMVADFEESEYREIRDRQMRDLELEDDLLNKPPVR